MEKKKQIKKFEKVVEYQEFASNKNGQNWDIIFLLSIPIIGTLVVWLYLICGREVYYQEIN